MQFVCGNLELTLNLARILILRDLNCKLWTEYAACLINIGNPIDRMEMPCFINMHSNVGEVYVVSKSNRNSKSKMEHGGIMCMWQRNFKDHQADVCLMLNVKPQKVVIACGVKWLTRIYGKWKGNSDVEDVILENELDEFSKKRYLNHDTYSKPNRYYEEESTDDLQNMVITEAVAIPRINVGSIFLVKG